MKAVSGHTWTVSPAITEQLRDRNLSKWRASWVTQARSVALTRTLVFLFRHREQDRTLRVHSVLMAVGHLRLQHHRRTARREKENVSDWWRAMRDKPRRLALSAAYFGVPGSTRAPGTETKSAHLRTSGRCTGHGSTLGAVDGGTTQHEGCFAGNDVRFEDWGIHSVLETPISR